jgi:transposase
MPVSGDQRARKELTPSERAQLVGAAKVGTPITQIARVFSIDESTVRYTLKKHDIRNNDASLPRSGRPKALSDRDRRTILRMIRMNPKMTCGKLIQEAGLEVSKKTVYRMLAAEGITNWTAKKQSNPPQA